MCSVCLVGSSEDELRLRLRLSLVPGHARPLSGGAFALRLEVTVGTSASDGALVNIVHNIRRGGRLHHQVVAMGVANISTRPVSLAARWVWGGPGAL